MSDQIDGPGIPPGRITARQRRALGIVLAAPTLTEGCKLAGIARSTWWTWRKTSAAFQRAVQAVEDQALAEGLARLKGGFLKAVEVLAELTASKNEGVRLQAVTVFLNQSIKAADSLDLRERLRALEARVGGAP